MYKQFPKREIIKEWDKLLKMSREEVVSLSDEWEAIDAYNKNLYIEGSKEKSKKIEEAVNSMKSIGIDVSKYKQKGFFKEKNGYQSWFKNNVVDVIAKKYPYYSSGVPTAHSDSKEVDGIYLANNQSPTRLIELYDRISAQYNNGLSKKYKDNKLIIKSIEYAKENDINIEDMTHKEIISTVDEYAKEMYLSDELPAGTEVYLKHACDECSTYIMGERRCSCGNRRIDIVVEGNIIDGFYHYPEPY